MNACADPAAVEIPKSFSAVDLGMAESGVPMPFDVNSHGQVVGSVQLASGGSKPFIWTNGSFSMLDLNGQATAISDGGAVAGSGILSAGAPKFHAFFWTPETGVLDVGVLRSDEGNNLSLASDVNDSGEVVGTEGESSSQAFAWTRAGGIRPLAVKGESQAVAVNDSGEIAGSFADTQALPRVPFIIRPNGEVVELPLPADRDVAQASDMNSHATVVGTYHFAATPNNEIGFVWCSQAGIQTIKPGADSTITLLAVNNHGLVLGLAGDNATGASTPFLWTERGGRVDVADLLGAGSIPFGMNDQGWVVGIQESSTSPTGFRGMVWVPGNGPSPRVAATGAHTVRSGRLAHRVIACLAISRPGPRKANLVQCLSQQ
jgi:probable HAF family extracellular repeat protein